MKSDFLKKIKDNRAQIGEGIYLLYFAVMIAVKAFGFYEGQMIFNLSLLFVFGLFAIKMLITKHTIKEYAVVAFFMLLAGIVYVKTGEKGLILYFCMMLGMKQVSVLKVVETGAIVSAIITLFKIFTGVFGLAEEIYYPQERAGIGLMFRHGLGYAHPNSLHMTVLSVMMLVMYYVSKSLMRKTNTIKLIIISVLAFLFNLYIFQYSGSRTGLLAGTAYLIINLWFCLREKPGILEKIACYISFPGTCFIAIVMPFILPESVFRKIDTTIFTTRFSIAKYFWSNNSPALFGIRLNNPDEWMSTYGLDMSQLYLFLQLGIVTFVVMACLTMWFIHYSLKNSHMAELAVLMGMLVMGIWEPHLYNLSFKNFVFVFMGAAIYTALAGNRKSDDIGNFTKNANDISGNSKDSYENSWISSMTLADLIKSMCFGAATGIASVMLFYLLTQEPSAFYGSRELNESGRSLGMEATYLTKEEAQELKTQGNFIVGYVDESTPMYKFDSQIALMEYERRGLSTGVFTGMATCLASVVLLTRKKKKEYQR
nr:hypothetical protein [uncultured Butyrivibrio sp.]